MNVRKTYQYLHKQFSLECKISANPIDKVYWSRNGVVLNQNEQHWTKDDNRVSYSQNMIDKYDHSNINDFYKIILKLSIMVSSLNKAFFVHLNKIFAF